MARAYVALTQSTTCLVSSNQDIATLPTPKPHNLSRPLYPKAQDCRGYRFTRLSMPLELAISSRAHWLSRVRSCLRLLIIVLSGAVVCMLMHTFEIYRGWRYIDLRKGEQPMVWPAHTNLAPSIVLFSIAAANFVASVAILTLSLKRSFRRPFRSRDVYRIVAGSFGVVTWITALVVFYLLNKASKASLGRYSCANKNMLTNGRYQYRAVCEEQGVAFYTAIAAAAAEIITLVTLAISAALSPKPYSDPPPTIRIREKNSSISTGSKFYKPLKR